MAEIIKRAKPKPVKAKKAAQSTEQVAPILQADDFRVPEERQALLKGAGLSAGISALLLLIALAIAAKLGAIIIIIVALWIIAPHGWLLWRVYQEKKQWATLMIAGSMPSPANRLKPQTISHEICRVLKYCPAQPIEVMVVPGKPAILTIGQTIVVTDELYQLTSDRDLLVLILHEIGHHFAKHLPLLPLARNAPSGDAMILGLMLPALPWFSALRDWMLLAEVTADRLVLIMKPDINLVTLGVIKEIVLMSPDSESRTHLVRFLGQADASIDRGEQLMISNEITTLFRANPDAEARVENLRTWSESAGYQAAVKRLHEGLAAKPAS
ncbi:MAG: M48 family metalloprotease [Armatimonadota bacterium]